jgi:predicted nucleic acid-binding protein
MWEFLDHKAVLLDTNLIIDAGRNGDAYAPFFKELEEQSVQAVTDWAIKYEFLRGANTSSDYVKKALWLDTVFGSNRLELDVTAKTYEDATFISSLMLFLNVKGASPIDCLIAAQLKRRQGHAYLATQNHKDFSLKLFNRKAVMSVEAGDEVRAIGIYEFSPEKYAEAVSRFLQA